MVVSLIENMRHKFPASGLEAALFHFRKARSNQPALSDGKAQCWQAGQ